MICDVNAISVFKIHPKDVALQFSTDFFQFSITINVSSLRVLLDLLDGLRLNVG